MEKEAGTLAEFFGPGAADDGTSPRARSERQAPPRFQKANRLAESDSPHPERADHVTLVREHSPFRKLLLDDVADDVAGDDLRSLPRSSRASRQPSCALGP